MTPIEKLRDKLNESLEPHGMKIIGGIDCARGGERKLDTVRWSASVGIRNLDNSRKIWSIASWDTVTDCVNNGFILTFNPPKGEAAILVDAKEK